MSEFIAAVKASDYETALTISYQLESICADSPQMNYSIGMVYHELKDDVKAAEYIKKAIDNPQRFELASDVKLEFWRNYAEFSQKGLEDSNQKLSADNKQLKDALAKSDAEVKKLHTDISDSKMAADVEKFRSSVVMWTGTGIAAAGIAAIAVGAVYVTKGYGEATGLTCKTTDGCIFEGGSAILKDKEKTEEEIYQYKYNEGSKVDVSGKFDFKATNNEKTGYIIMAAGITATVVGAVMTGLGAYYYTHPSTDIALSDSVSLSWDVSPANVQFGLTF